MNEPRRYACPRCFLVVPGLYELDLIEGLTAATVVCCHECAGALFASAAIDPAFVVAVLSERGAPVPLRGHLRAVNG